ncbi:ASCH domain-containing protein [Ferrimicrobium sp.]|uniref:ASCH domain-containing protein n=1 Tax=Ferrimicrobium sp. TaxID=2926050 RepID=UPI0026393EE2|nr:ASCH domain-containing protein [Ferrimicrobium sp.]
MNHVLPTTSFGYDGDEGLGDRLLAAVLRGEKTATSSLVVEYLSGEPLPRVGQRSELVDHAGRRHGMIETTRVRIIPLDEVGDDVARDESKSLTNAAEWRRAHEAFWRETIEMIRADAGDPTWELRDSEPVVVEWFRLLNDQGPSTD